MNSRQPVSMLPISMLIVASFLGTLSLTGCQPTAKPADDDQVSSQSEADSKPGVQSDSAAARIEEFEPLYVKEMQELQQRLQAEYEALQAADAPDSSSILPNSVSKPTPNDTDKNTDTDSTTTAATSENTASNADTSAVSTDKAGAEINTSTEVGERDLEVLKLIRIGPRKPSLLTENQLIKRYQQAMQALYEPASIPLSAQDIDTLLNIMTLLPELFEHAEIAERVSIKSPALARLITQHQVWQQIEVQQALDMEQMKINQQQEFEALMKKFNDTIESYDEQIAKYEQTLEEFQ
ncbi:hypothetical protein [uncultured Psychrobacter sp.]|uniref:hypothetical protein n=1 Tax=uncultured Psychrobacter sp. TaxID=259303 RepID=UPI00345A1E23